MNGVRNRKGVEGRKRGRKKWGGDWVEAQEWEKRRK